MLTERELDILQLLAQGLSDRDIADHLFIALTTVKWYNRQIFNKLGVNGRQQAVDHAIDLGLLKQSNPFSTTVSKLPVQITPFVDRVSELDDLTRLLIHPDTRFVTILAPGGMGKSRLAVAAAEFVNNKFPDGVHFVACAELESDNQLILTIGTALGVQFFPDNRTPNQQLFDFLAMKHALLILDNFEHLLGVAKLVIEILVAAPMVKILITSRERLNIEGETVFSLGGTDFPESVETEETRLDYGAVQLFAERANRANANSNTQDEFSIVRICRLVEGMPLALELAAAWSTTLSPNEIADEIQKDTDFLHTTLRNVPERFQSVRSVFETTWRRMTDDERRGFCSLSIFRGGFTRPAAQAVASVDSHMLQNLVSKALVWRRSSNNRYEIHELLRQYGEERLRESAENYQGITEKYCRWYAEYVTHDQVEAMTMGTRIAVLNKGELQQLDTPFNLYNNPRNLFVAGFIGSPSMNFLEATLRREDSQTIIETSGFSFPLPAALAAEYQDRLPGRVILGIRPEDIHSVEFQSSGMKPILVEASIDIVEQLGSELILYLKEGGQTLIARTDPRTPAHVGQRIAVAINPDNIHLFDADTEQSLSYSYRQQHLQENPSVAA